VINTFSPKFLSFIEEVEMNASEDNLMTPRSPDGTVVLSTVSHMLMMLKQHVASIKRSNSKASFHSNSNTESAKNLAVKSFEALEAGHDLDGNSFESGDSQSVQQLKYALKRKDEEVQNLKHQLEEKNHMLAMLTEGQ
jgi:hypothetical protein